MCVIMQIPPDFEINEDFAYKMESACLVNPDGYGLMVPDRGVLHVRKEFGDNDPEKILRMMEEAKKQGIIIHLRFRTKGTKDISNCHPFNILKPRKDGMHIEFMHNGTLPHYGNQADCDSRVFAKEIIRPLARALSDNGSPLAEPLFQKIMSDYAGNGSFFLMDEQGQYLRCGSGYELDGFWASNKYSFERSHRSSEKDTKKVAKKVVSLPKLPDSITSLTKDVDPSELQVEVAEPPERPSFCEMSGIPNLQDACQLTRENIEDMIVEDSDMAATLIQDLLLLLYSERSNRFNDPIPF